jgi:hypothetical protein
MQVVDDRKTETLIPSIQRVANPDSIIHSDQWRTYSRINSELQLEHGTALLPLLYLALWLNRLSSIWMITAVRHV